ncbi:MAG: hypothetical protein HRT35_12570 [Algicola sp.]|nr:hypothetical protein [Algicola sp.]
MFNIFNRKLVIAAAAVLTLAGCQASSVDYSSIRSASNDTTTPAGKRLGGGFVKGMTPAQTCIYFYDHYKVQRNNLCSKVDSANFSELTIVTNNIVKSPDMSNPIKTIAFFFDKNARLNLVQAVVDDGADDSNNRNKTIREISNAYTGGRGN